MNTRVIALTCALTATACGGAESKPAQDPASGYNLPGSKDTSSTTVASATAPVAPAPNTAVGTATTPSGRETGGARTSVAPSSATPAAPNNPGAPDATKSPDNTKVNERDRSDATLTPMDQGNSGAETKISAAIRRGLMGDKHLSFNAKNVKIITIGSKVTLRGPVTTDQEKATIEALAKQTPGVSDVDNQLEVKK